MRHTLLSVLFIVLALATLSLARDPITNNWEKDWSQDLNVGVAEVDINGPTKITIRDPNNGTCGLGQFRFQCICDGRTQFDLDIPIKIAIEVQQRLTIRDVYLWFGATGTTSNTDYTNWGNPSVPSNGVTYAFHSLNGFLFETTITLRELISLISNPNGSFRTCLRVEFVVRVERYCGFSNQPRAFRHSPEGCDFDYQAIYPASDAYFHVALNNDGSAIVNNDTLYFKGYCLDPTRSVYPNYHYNGQIYSSYDSQVLNSNSGDFVEAPQNFPLVNYIANHESEYLSRFLNGHQCTWQDIQNAIWRVLFPVATTNDPQLREILANSSEDCVSWIVNDARANGVNYIPFCPGGKYLLIIYPMLPDNCNCTKDTNTQLVAFLTGGSCLNKCAPRVCSDLLTGSGRICLTGNCAPLPSPSVSLTSRPIFPSDSNSVSTSYSSSASTSYSSTSSPSYSSSASTSYSSSASTSYSNTVSTSYSSSASTSYSSSASTSYSSSASTSYSSSASRSYSSSATNSRTPCPSASSTPEPSDSKTTRPSRSASSTPCPSRSSTPEPSDSKTTRPSRSSTPEPSESSTPCPSRTRSKSPSRSEECHRSDSPSNSPPCHMSRSSSPSRSAPCHASPSPSPCGKNDDRPGQGGPGHHGDRP